MNGEVILNTKKGKLRGKIMKDYNGSNFYSFQGIRYGKPPIAELRFQAPVEPEPWKGIRDATQEGNTSMSVNKSGEITGSEDCLFLNVYTPKIVYKEPLFLRPVMFWVHGGVFVRGSGNTDLFGPEYLMTENILLVTVNYRLGMLGFLSLEEQFYNIPGNAALKDLVLALKWVQTNIETFGGDPKNVTINGSSAGAALIQYLILSPLAKGLFHKAIVQSGSALSPWGLARKANEKDIKLLGCDCIDEQNIINFFFNSPAEKLVQVQQNILNYYLVQKQRALGPVIEDNVKSAFLTEHPVDIIKSGKYNKVPLIIGYNADEGILSDQLYSDKKFNFHEFNDFGMCIPYYLNIPSEDKILKIMEDKIKQYYYRNTTSDKLEKIKNFYMLQTDALFLQGIYHSIQLFQKNLDQPIYFYRLSADTKLNVLKNIFGIKFKGTCHGDELGYLFKNIFNDPIEKNSIEEFIMLRMIRLWGNFVRTGDPNKYVKGSTIDVTWSPVKVGKYNCLDIGTKLSVGINLDIERMEFWDEIFNLCSYPSKYKGFF